LLESNIYGRLETTRGRVLLKECNFNFQSTLNMCKAEKNVVVPVTGLGLGFPEKVGTEGDEFLFIKYFYFWRHFFYDGDEQNF
jgi:hypothetical protein